ncbi:MAG: hypothetical protein APU95_01335 [Hadesarchaea archaeon YNP_N21]|jgi:hypothetical protein|nr:MAG: hypothetical protein APU95_01335 [Hadesarchaea archaeon YNP_N21]
MGWRGWLPLSLLVFGFFSFASCPTVCVIIPERVIIERIPRPVPDPASETAAIKAFISYGFHVVDQAQVKFLRTTDSKEICGMGSEAIRMPFKRLVVDISAGKTSVTVSSSSTEGVRGACKKSRKKFTPFACIGDVNAFSH